MLAPYIDEIRDSLSEPLGVTPSQISVKAKTSENIGPEGLKEAISARAVVLLGQNEND